jgi:hypothetical protein
MICGARDLYTFSWDPTRASASASVQPASIIRPWSTEGRHFHSLLFLFCQSETTHISVDFLHRIPTDKWAHCCATWWLHALNIVWQIGGDRCKFIISILFLTYLFWKRNLYKLKVDIADRARLTLKYGQTRLECPRKGVPTKRFPTTFFSLLSDQFLLSCHRAF